MNIFKRIFGKTEMSEELSTNKDKMVKLSSVVKERIPANAQIISESQIPQYCNIGNLIFEKKFKEAIDLGNKLLEETPTSAGVHVNLMEAYFKIRKENPINNEKVIEHAKLAMLFGHNTGYVQERLAISLEQVGQIEQAIQICDIVLRDDFHFSSHGCGNKEDFKKRKEKLIKKLNKSPKDNQTPFFTDDEVSFTIKQIQLEDEREKKEQREYEKRIKNFEKEFRI